RPWWRRAPCAFNSHTRAMSRRLPALVYTPSAFALAIPSSRRARPLDQKTTGLSISLATDSTSRAMAPSGLGGAFLLLRIDLAQCRTGRCGLMMHFKLGWWATKLGGPTRRAPLGSWAATSMRDQSAADSSGCRLRGDWDLLRTGCCAF